MVGDLRNVVNGSLRQLLTLDRLPWSDRATVLRALSHAVCWPRDPALVARALQLRPAGGSAPKAGETPLLSVTPGHRTALWMLRWTPRETPALVPFVHEARRALEQAGRLAARDLALLPDPHAVSNRPTWSAELVYVLGVGTDAALDGGSFGLSFCLAEASLLLQCPLPSSLCATAVVRSDGSLAGVDGLAEKLRLTASCALSVTDLLVAAEQASVAEQLRVDNGYEALRIVPVEHLRDALRIAFPDGPERAIALWTSPEDADSAARKLFFAAIEGNGALLDWAGVAAAAEHVRAALHTHRAPESSVVRAEYALAIARRHAGLPAQLPWPETPWLQSLPRPHRLAVLAHAVQSLGEAPDELAWESKLDTARQLVADKLERHPEDLRVLGAIGRALAAWDATAPAIALLDEALRGWIELDRAEQSTHALCELLRLHALENHGAAVQSLLAHEVPLAMLDARTEPMARAFLSFSVGRALALLGQPADAISSLAEPLHDWNLTRPALRRSRLRWLAALQRMLGNVVGSEETLARLCKEAPEHNAFVLLAKLDRSLALGHSDEVAQYTDALLHAPVSAEVRRIARQHTARGGNDETFPTHLARYFRY